MSARVLVALLFAGPALASPAYDLEPVPVSPKSFYTPVERSWQGLELALRQSRGCPSGWDDCSDRCYPLDGSVCCGLEGTFCRAGTRCSGSGCCPLGKICTGTARTITHYWDEPTTTTRVFTTSLATTTTRPAPITTDDSFDDDVATPSSNTYSPPPVTSSVALRSTTVAPAVLSSATFISAFPTSLSASAVAPTVTIEGPPPGPQTLAADAQSVQAAYAVVLVFAAAAIALQ